MLELCTGSVFPLTEMLESVRRKYPGSVNRPAGLATNTLPVTWAPRGATVWPPMIIGSSRTALNASPDLAVALDTEDCRRIVTAVPAGSRCGTGTKDSDGEIPSLFWLLSNGTSCGRDEAWTVLCVGVSAAIMGVLGCRPQPTTDEVIRTISASTNVDELGLRISSIAAHKKPVSRPSARGMPRQSRAK
jgi:hypothetical protein